MKHWQAIIVFACALALAGSAAGQATKGKAPAAAGALAPDKGKFKLVVDSQQVGTEEFSVAPSGGDWVSRGSVEIKVPGAPTTQVTGELRMAADGRPIRYEFSSQGGKKTSGTVVFEGNSAKMELRAESGQPFTQEFQFDSPLVVILDNNLYHHYGVLARLYNWETKGVQTFSVLIPQDLTPGTVTVEWAGPQEYDGVKAELLRVRSADLEIELYVTAGRLVRVAVPVSKADIRRE